MIKKHKVLVVEDSEEARYLLSVFLEKRGIEFKMAETIKEGIEDFETGEYDIVLLDMVFDESSGLEFIYKVRATSKWEDKSIIVTSSMRDRKVVLKALSLGANDYIAKPIDEDILTDKMLSYAKNNQLVSLPVFPISSKAKFSNLEFEFKARIITVHEDEMIILSNAFWSKSQNFTFSSPLLKEVGFDKLILPVKSVQVLTEQDYSYEIVVDLSVLSLEDQMNIRRWILA